jgi:hypothetical protein
MLKFSVFVIIVLDQEVDIIDKLVHFGPKDLILLLFAPEPVHPLAAHLPLHDHLPGHPDLPLNRNLHRHRHFHPHRHLDNLLPLLLIRLFLDHVHAVAVGQVVLGLDWDLELDRDWDLDLYWDFSLYWHWHLDLDWDLHHYLDRPVHVHRLLYLERALFVNHVVYWPFYLPVLGYHFLYWHLYLFGLVYYLLYRNPNLFDLFDQFCDLYDPLLDPLRALLDLDNLNLDLSLNRNLLDDFDLLLNYLFLDNLLDLSPNRLISPLPSFRAK